MSQQLSLGVETPVKAAPFVKWCGGKRRMMDHLLAHLPKGPITSYVEPFCGGAALFWELKHRNPGMVATLRDINFELIETYRAIRDYPDLLMDHLRMHVAKHGKEHFLETRDEDPQSFACWEIGARFIYLNRAGFNGLYRVNRSGKFNVAFGKKPEVAIDEANIMACHQALQNVTIEWSPFQKEWPAPPGSFVYIDPPYDETFTAYSSIGFTDIDQVSLRDYILGLIESGCKVLISNSDTCLTRGLYMPYEFTIHEVSVHRSVSSKASTRGEAKELLITAGYDL